MSIKVWRKYYYREVYEEATEVERHFETDFTAEMVLNFIHGCHNYKAYPLRAYYVKPEDAIELED